MNPFQKSFLALLSQKVLFIFWFVTVGACQSVGSKVAEGDPALPDFEMISESIRVERFSNSKLLRARGPVVTDCGGRPCSREEVRNLPISKIRSFPRTGIWEIYAQTQESKDNLRDRVFVNYLDMVGEFANDNRVGVWKAFHRDSRKVSAEIPYVKGVRDGIQKNFDPDGRLSGEVPWRNDKRHGIEKSYSATGEILSETRWIHGKKEGPYYRNISVRGNTQKLEEGFYKDDKKHGEWKFYDPGEGYLRQVAFYINGELNGKERNFHPSGTIASEGENRNGSRVGTWKIFYPDGKLQAEGSYSPSDDPEIRFKRTGIWKEYYRNGKLFAEGPRDHIRTGRWIFYFQDGQVAFRGVMKNEAMMESAEIYERDGRKLSEGKLFFSIVNIDEEKDELRASYRPDIPHTYFHPNGKRKLVIQSQSNAVEYDESGNEMGRGGADAQGRKNGCWTENGRAMFYALGNPRPSMTATACR